VDTLTTETSRLKIAVLNFIHYESNGLSSVHHSQETKMSKFYLVTHSGRGRDIAKGTLLLSAKISQKSLGLGCTILLYTSNRKTNTFVTNTNLMTVTVLQ
jgi:hypothetical protein